MSDDELDWAPTERALLDSALDFFGAAEAVIDYVGPDRPHLRYDVDGLQDVRNAMAALEERVHVAAEAGVTPERIASITRLEQEIVELIIARHRTSPDGESDEPLPTAGSSAPPKSRSTQETPPPQEPT